MLAHRPQGRPLKSQQCIKGGFKDATVMRYNPRKIIIFSATLTCCMVLPFVVQAAAAPYSESLRAIATLLFIAFFTFLAAITLLAIAVMLVIRYVYLTILLILSPIIWLLWIFPSTQSYWKKWWTNFMKWAFFAPIMLFFLYLTIATIKTYPKALAQYARDTNRLPLENQPVQIDFALIGHLVALLGLMAGGLYAANSMGIAGAKTFYGWAEKSGKAFGGWAGRKGIRAGTRPLRGKLGTQAIEGMEKLGTTWARPFKTMAWPVRQLGARLSRLGATGAERLVSEAEKRLPADDNRLAKMIHTLAPEEQIAALQRLRKNKSLDLIPDTSAFINDETKARWLRYGQPAPDYTNMERTVGFNIAMLKAAKGGNATDLRTAALGFYKGFRPEHFTKMQVDEFFGKDPEFGLDRTAFESLQKESIKAIMETNPDGLANIYRNIKGVNRDNFHNNLLVPYLKAQAAAAPGGPDVMTWLKSTNPSLHTFFNSPTAHSLGITI